MEVPHHVSHLIKEVRAGFGDEGRFCCRHSFALPNLAAVDLCLTVGCGNQPVIDELFSDVIGDICGRAIDEDRDQHLVGRSCEVRTV